MRTQDIKNIVVYNQAQALISVINTADIPKKQKAEMRNKLKGLINTLSKKI